MDSKTLLTVTNFIFVLASAFVVNKDVINSTDEDIYRSDVDVDEDVVSLKDNAGEVFNGVYSECFLYLSYTCVQKKTLLYLKELDKLSEVSVIGEYVKFVKLNTTEKEENNELPQPSLMKNSDELSFLIDEAVDKFFNNHILKFSALGRDITMPQTVDKFVGRKRKGGGGGGGGGGHGGGGHGGGDDGGKKKMMMMAMMCMKMKLMMMVPAMMGMMGMMSFKGMMFSMMSFMISKMMLLMKILEKKGGGGGLGGGDGGWAAGGGGGGGGGGAWMPAGGQDYGGGGGYDANGQWQSRSIDTADHEATVTYVRPARANEKTSAAMSLSNELVKINQENIKSRLKRDVDTGDHDAVETSYVRPALANKSFNNGIVKIKQKKLKSRDRRDNNYSAKLEGLISSVRPAKANSEREVSLNNQLVDINQKKLKARSKRDFDDIEKEKHTRHSRTKRGIVDILQNAYAYWMNRMLGVNNNRRFSQKYPKYKVVQGVKYVYYPLKYLQKMKTPKEISNTEIKPSDGGFKPMIVMDNTKTVPAGGFDPIIATEDFNKGEIVEAPIESRSLKKMKKKMKDFSEDVSAVIEENPWE